MSKHHGIEQEMEEMAPYVIGGYEDTKATIEFLQSVIENQALEIEALKLRIDDLRGFSLTRL